MTITKYEKSLRLGRLMYIFEAALEYFISILVASSFLATLTGELGMSDSLTGILSSVISLGCLFQLLSVTVKPARSKPFVMVMSVLNQLLFMLLYVIPLFNFGKEAKTALFVITIFSAYLIYNFAHPKKINWLFSLVDDNKRGSFTANKEIVSLISGMLFTFGAGAVIDSFKDKGEIHTAFIITAAAILVLTALHTLTMALAIEKPIAEAERKSLKESLRDIIKNQSIRCVTAVFVIYYIATYASLPFYGTYQIRELGLSLTFVSALSIVTSVSRILFSKFWGKYADKNGFADMMQKCLIFSSLGYLAIVFAVPSNGKLLFTLYYIFNGIAQGGINSALINLVFDYVPAEKRSDSLAVCQAVSGTAGFLATLLFSVAVKAIQQNSNTVFGINIYAQQAVSAVSLILTLLLILYVKKLSRTKN